MFAGAGLVTLIAATLVQQWATSRHTPYEPPEMQAVLEPPQVMGVNGVNGKTSAGECGSGLFNLGSPFATRKTPRP